MTASPATEVSDASRLRRRLVQQLHAHNHIRSAAVEHAFRTVPRHVFAPEVRLPVSYADDIVPTCHADDGTITSSISAPSLRADMLEAAHPTSQSGTAAEEERRVSPPDKCTRWKVWDPAALPDGLVPYTRSAIEGIKNGELYSETGWPA
ncbi:hypothetical protein ACIBSR_34330 [Streptomyces sp. NPDC049936]|uniref:hypothetical protein n=1 Tax=Streptomyces sp. NPDC049936 TaxID=3365599 RepID=UPI00378B4466